METSLDQQLDTTLDCLSNSSRRLAVTHLRRQHGVSIHLDDLADHVVRGTHETPPREHRATALSLYHVHLPKLADAGLIQFDPESKTARYTASTDIDRLLETLESVFNTQKADVNGLEYGISTN